MLEIAAMGERRGHVPSERLTAPTKTRVEVFLAVENKHLSSSHSQGALMYRTGFKHILTHS